MIEENRIKFEKWISAEPFNCEIARFSHTAEFAWPGQYMNLRVQMAWCAWCEALGLPGDINA